MEYILKTQASQHSLQHSAPLDRSAFQRIAVQAAKANRKRFRDSLDGDVVLLRGQREVGRNGDVHFDFRQSSDVLYLSACNLPDIVLILSREREIILIPKVDELHRVWLGDVPSPSDIQEQFGFEEANTTDQCETLLKDVCKGALMLICSSADLEGQLNKRQPLPVRPWRHDIELAEFRVIKSQDEIKLMQAAADASSSAHLHAMSMAQPGMAEWQVKDLFKHHLQSWGLRDLSFPTIAGSGKGGATLHYTQDNAILDPKDLLLLDAGGEWMGYAADITRTWPIGKCFSKEQADIYQIVLDAQAAGTALAQPGRWVSELQEVVIKTLTKGLLDLGILKGKFDDLIEHDAIRCFYPHGCSHQLGCDVHDVSPPMVRPNSKASVRSDQCLREDMVITMEPGLYFIDALIHSKDQREKLKDLVQWDKAEAHLNFGGIRIEDDLLITKDGSRSLSDVPKSISDINTIRSSAPS